MDVHAAVQLRAIVVQRQVALQAGHREEWRHWRKSRCLLLHM